MANTALAYDIPPAGRGRFSIPLAACAVVLLHLLLSFLLPQQAWITCTAWIAMYALGLATTLREASIAPFEARWRWRMVAVNFTLAIGCFLCILYTEYSVRFVPAAVWINDLLRTYRSLPLLLAVCTPEESDHRINRLLDCLQVFLIAIVFFIVFLPGYPANGRGMSPPDPGLVNSYNYTLACILAALAMLAVFTAKTSGSRLFHRVLAMYLWIGVPINLWTNRVLINTLSVPPASALFVPSDFCLLALIVAVPLVRAKTTTRTPSRRLLFLRLSAPVFLPLTTILASMILAVSSHHHVAGIAFGIAGLAIFGVRSAYGQFQLLATQSSLESANQDLEALSKRDPLTGLYNRRWFSEAYTLAWQRAQRSRQPLSLVLIDVDHFKLFNDTLGHAAGDFCLESIAKALSSKLHRVGDALVRYGGEELLAILENTDSEGAQHVAQMFLDSVSKLQLPHPASPFNCVTISIGFATCSDPQPEFTRDDLLLQADQALYTAKREGRNCIRSTAATTHPSAESDPPTSSNEPRPL